MGRYIETPTTQTRYSYAVIDEGGVQMFPEKAKKCTQTVTRRPRGVGERLGGKTGIRLRQPPSRILRGFYPGGPPSLPRAGRRSPLSVRQ